MDKNASKVFNFSKKSIVVKVWQERYTMLTSDMRYSEAKMFKFQKIFVLKLKMIF